MINFDEERESGKLIKVYLPQYIIEIFQRDMEIFEIKRNNKANLSKLCNLIFENTKDIYLAESNKLKNLFQKEWIQNTFRTILSKKYDISEENAKKISDTVSKKFEEISEDIFKPDKMQYSDYISFRLNKKNATAFSIIEKDLGKHFTISDYFRNIFLLYAIRPQYEREKIICFENYAKIQYAIKNKLYLMMKIRGLENYMKQIPYFIKHNREEVFNYVILLDDKRSEKNPRLSTIEDVLVLENEKYFITKKEETFLEEIKKNFDPFATNFETIKIQLTKKGKYLFSRMIHNRPPVDKIEGDVYIFNCATAKIEAYFFKFGAEAKILEPKRLARDFMDNYRKAYESYLEKKESE